MDKITETSTVPNREFHWQFKMKYQAVVFAAYPIVILMPIWSLWDLLSGEFMWDFLLVGIAVWTICLWIYILLRDLRGQNVHVTLTENAILYWTDSRKPYASNNFLAKFINRYEQAISKRNQIFIPNAEIQAIYIPNSRDRIILRRVQGRRRIIELNDCQSEETREALLEAILHYYKPVISQA